MRLRCSWHSKYRRASFCFDTVCAVPSVLPRIAHTRREHDALYLREPKRDFFTACQVARPLLTRWSENARCQRLAQARPVISSSFRLCLLDMRRALRYSRRTTPQRDLGRTNLARVAAMAFIPCRWERQFPGIPEQHDSAEPHLRPPSGQHTPRSWFSLRS